MGRPDTLPHLMVLLEEYLDRRVALWSAQPEMSRSPTLPSTSDGKVNVRQLVKDIGLSGSAEQHFYNKAQLTRAVNLIASEQGLKGIGSRVLQDADDWAARVRIAQLAARSKADGEGHAAARVQLARMAARIQQLEGEVCLLRARLDHVRATGMMVRITPINDDLDNKQ
jgi:hypothetical protein